MSLSKRYQENLPRRSSETKCLLLVHAAALLLLLQPLLPVFTSAIHHLASLLFPTILENCLEEKEAPLLLLLLLLCCKCFSLTRDFKLQSIEPLDPDRRCQHLPKGDATFCLSQTFNQNVPSSMSRSTRIDSTNTHIHTASKQQATSFNRAWIHTHTYPSSRGRKIQMYL